MGVSSDEYDLLKRFESSIWCMAKTLVVFYYPTTRDGTVPEYDYFSNR